MPTDPAAPSHAHLPGRVILEVSGPDARAFLDRLVTCDIDRVAPERAGYGALLTPQGKILADFLIFQAEDQSFLLDTAEACWGELAKRLNMYRLRANVAVRDRSGELAVLAEPSGTPGPSGALAVADDPRRPELGWRAVATRAGPGPGPSAYDERRIRLGVPEGGVDFAFGDAFPHEALMDQLGGVAFDKGCYVGQEVVSRMQHRGTARTRILRVAYEGDAPPSGTELTAGDRALGRTSSASGSSGLATVRVDRAADAIRAGDTIRAGGRTLRFDKPDWVRFLYPDELARAPAA